MAELLSQIGTGVCENKIIDEKILQLSKRIQNTKGKRVYGYLKADVKNIVDQIVEELSKEERIVKLYDAWYGCQDEILKTYSNKTAETISFAPLCIRFENNLVLTRWFKYNNFVVVPFYGCFGCWVHLKTGLVCYRTSVCHDVFVFRGNPVRCM